MKTAQLKFYVFPSDNFLLFDKFLDNHIFRSNNEFVFGRKSENKIERKLDLIPIVIRITNDNAEKIYKKITNDIYEIINYANSKFPIMLSQETERKISEVVYSTVYKFANDDDFVRASIFDFVTSLFIRLMIKHALIDGNKRISLISLRVILRRLGYYLKWNECENEDSVLKTYKNDVIHFVKSLQNKSEKCLNIENEDFQKIKNWIRENTLFLFPTSS